MSFLVADNKKVGAAYIPSAAVAAAVTFDREMMHVELEDGRVISVPIKWFPRLTNATQSERENYDISPSGLGIHWPDVDEDLSVAGFLAGVDPAFA